MNIGNLIPIINNTKIIALGIEGSANKIGVGKEISLLFSLFLEISLISLILFNFVYFVLFYLIKGVLIYEDNEYKILSNPRKTFISPPGSILSILFYFLSFIFFYFFTYFIRTRIFTKRNFMASSKSCCCINSNSNI